MAEHCILGAQLQPLGRPASSPLTEAELERLLASIQALEAWIQGCADRVPQGYISSKGSGAAAASH